MNIKTSEPVIHLLKTNVNPNRGIYRLSVFMFGLLLLLSSQSHALEVTRTSVYNQPITAAGVTSAINVMPVLSDSLTPFDSSLGTLEDVQVRIYGDVIFSGLGGASWYNNGLAIIPVPYRLESQFSFNLIGLGSEYFSLGSPVELGMTYNVSGSTGGIPIAATTSSFSLSFDYNDLLNMFLGPSDVSCSGCTSFIPPVTMAGTLEDFIDTNILVDQMLMNYELSFQTTGQFGGYPSSITANSVIFIDTIYTYSEISVPEPSSLILLIGGLVGFTAYRRKNRNNR